MEDGGDGESPEEPNGDMPLLDSEPKSPVPTCSAWGRLSRGWPLLLWLLKAELREFWLLKAELRALWLLKAELRALWFRKFVLMDWLKFASEFMEF